MKNLMYISFLEWRFLGKAYDKPKAPKVRTIYLGKNISTENEHQMITFAEKNGIIIKKLN